MNPLADDNPFDADHLSGEEKLRNVAGIVLKYTELKYREGRKNRCNTYAADADAIAQTARHLAEDVIAYPGR